MITPGGKRNPAKADLGAGTRARRRRINPDCPLAVIRRCNSAGRGVGGASRWGPFGNHTPARRRTSRTSATHAHGICTPAGLWRYPTPTSWGSCGLPPCSSCSCSHGPKYASRQWRLGPSLRSLRRRHKRPPDGKSRQLRRMAHKQTLPVAVPQQSHLITSATASGITHRLWMMNRP